MDAPTHDQFVATPAPEPRTIKGHPLLGVLPEFRRDPLAFLSKVAESSTAVRARFGAQSVVFAIAPEAVERVLVTGARHYDKRTRGYGFLKLVLGEGLVTAEGDVWRGHRRLVQPAFHRANVRGWAEMMVTRTEQLVCAWVGTRATQNGAVKPVEVDIHAAMMALTLQIVSDALFSADLARHADTIAGALAVAVEYVEHATWSLAVWPRWLPTPRNRRFARALRALDDIVLQLIAERRASGARAPDLLDTLLHAVDRESGEPLEDRVLRDELMTLMSAGHETTANALTWTLYLLSKHPSTEAAARAEVDAILGDRSVTVDDVPQFALIERILKESMRLYPPVWVIERAVRSADDLGGHQVRVGDKVMVSAWATHHCPSIWPEPERFDPDRFLPEAEALRHKFAYHPFSAGTRKCIGDGFAMLEAKLILVTLLQRCRLHGTGAGDLLPEPLVTLRPRGGLTMTVERRDVQCGAHASP